MTAENSNECFVIMPISDPDGYARGHFKEVLDGILAPACEDAGYRAVRADQVTQTNFIHLDMLRRLLDAPMVLCDLSTHNPNVLFELALRQAFDKPVVLVQEVGTPKIFDIAMFRYTEYRTSFHFEEVPEDREKIKATLLSTKEAFAAGQGVNSIVRLLSLVESASLKEPNPEDAQSGVVMLLREGFEVIRTEIGALRATQNEPSAVSSARVSPPSPRPFGYENIVDTELRASEVAINTSDARVAELSLQRAEKMLTQWWDALVLDEGTNTLTVDQYTHAQRRFYDQQRRLSAVLGELRD